MGGSITLYIVISTTNISSFSLFDVLIKKTT